MTLFNIRQGTKLFTDRVKFPYGFKKSGDFSISEAELLSYYGFTLFKLEQGEIKPETADEKHFLAVVKGKATATTLLEKTWLKYIRLSRHARPFHTLHGKAKNQSDFYENDVEDYDIAG